MEILELLVKHIVIFLGGGFALLFAFWVVEETSEIPLLILQSEKEKNSPEKIKVKKIEKLAPNSALYELFLPEGRKIKILSSYKGMKIF